MVETHTTVKIIVAKWVNNVSVRFSVTFHTHEEVGFGGRLPEVLLDVLGLIGDHADQRVQLDDCHTQIDQIHWVSQQSSQCWDKVCEGTEVDKTRTQP